MASVHQGGYDPFSFDITDALVESKTQDLVVKVINPTGEGNYPYQPRGKLSLTPGEIFYTNASGIWQTVWLEPVSSNYIQSIRLTPDVANKQLSVKVLTNNDASVVAIASSNNALACGPLSSDDFSIPKRLPFSPSAFKNFV